MSKFTEYAWAETRALRDTILGLPFNRELAEGALSQERYRPVFFPHHYKAMEKGLYWYLYLFVGRTEPGTRHEAEKPRQQASKRQMPREAGTSLRGTSAYWRKAFFRTLATGLRK